MIFNYKLLSLLLLILINSVGSSPASSSETRSFKVLMLNDSAVGRSQQIIEEAAALSLDLPLNRPTSANNELESTNANATDYQSPGYEQSSLASLTLHQRRQARTARSGESPDIGSTPAAWKEVYMPRHKPSWLDVSSRFKITGTSIEELEYMMPTEYLLRQAFDSPILLKTKLGILEGVRSIKFNKHLYTFLSVPYAKPPVGELRFKAPQSIEKWDGILQTTKWPPFCVQPSMTLASKSSPVHVLSRMMSEDCLYLNIWTPSLKFNKTRRRPVMVWIHGGAFQYGGISVDENDGSALALLGDVVVVTLNYRISAFGFLNANNPQNAPNNVGLLDQQKALEWVRDNIRHFGGDPHLVTLFGESAGGHSVGLHMISPTSQGLFKRAILQSGVPISYLRSYDVNSDNRGPIVAEGVGSVMMARRLKCLAMPAPEPEEFVNFNETELAISGNGTKVSEEEEETEEGAAGDPSNSTTTVDVPLLSDSVLECMRNKSSLEILKALGSPGNAGFFPTGNDPKGFFPQGPIMESFDPDQLKIGPQKEYLIGTNTDEGTFMLHYGMPSLFPSKSPPKVNSIEELKALLAQEIEKMSKSANRLTHSNVSDAISASGSGNGGAQAHLYRPLLRTSTSILEGFVPKSKVRVLENGTVVGNTSEYSREAEFGKSVGSLITDIIFLCPARSLARTLADAGRNVYFYLYGHRSSQTQYHDWIGVTHHDEVEFVFGRPLRLADVHAGKDIDMSQRLIKTWSYFAYTGQAQSQLGVEWPKYGGEDSYYMNLVSGEASIGERYHDKVCNIYDTVISVHLQDT